MATPPAHLYQERHVELVSGAQEQFVVTSTMYSATIPDQLPHLEVFVMQVNDRLDPPDDTLARVARISDLTSLPKNRDAALAASRGTGQTYLSQTCVLNYSTLVEAMAGAQAIQDRVNALIEDWINFTLSFNAPDPAPADIPLPTADASQKQSLINAYAAAKQAAYAQLQVKNAADDAVTAAQDEVTELQTIIDSLNTIATSAETVSTEMNTVAGALTTLKSAGDTFFAAASCAATGDKTTFQAALNVGANQETLDTGYVSDAAALHTSVTGLATTEQSALDAANTTLTNAIANQVSQASLLTQLQASESAALYALLAVAPDFDPTTVPYVPGTPSGSSFATAPMQRGVVAFSAGSSGAGYDYQDVVLSPAMPSTNYEIFLAVGVNDDTSGTPVVSYRLKTTSGFRIRTQSQFAGEVSWRAVPA